MSTLQLAVVTPEGAAFEGAATCVVVPAFDGELAIYPSHAPMVGSLGNGELRVTDASGSVQHFFLAGGVVQVVDNEVTILAESVETGAKVDPVEAERELQEAMTSVAALDDEIDARQAAIDRARARLRIANR